jgi:hypothetical protein
MDISSLNELKFLLKLLECKNGRTSVASSSLRSFKGKEQLCANLARDGLIDFSREIAAIELAASGRELLKLEESTLPLSASELKLLRKLGKAATRLTPNQVSVAGIKASERDAILQGFCDRGFVTVETKLKRQKAEVWLTEAGKTCITQLVNQFQQLRQLTVPSTTTKPQDREVLRLIQMLDRTLGTDNFLPIFHLREQLPSLTRTEVDELLYRLQRNDQIQLRAIVHTQGYTSEQLQAGIQQRAGSPLFFIEVI